MKASRYITEFVKYDRYRLFNSTYSLLIQLASSLLSFLLEGRQEPSSPYSGTSNKPSNLLLADRWLFASGEIHGGDLLARICISYGRTAGRLASSGSGVIVIASTTRVGGEGAGYIFSPGIVVTAGCSSPGDRKGASRRIELDAMVVHGVIVNTLDELGT